MHFTDNKLSSRITMERTSQHDSSQTLPLFTRYKLVLYLFPFKLHTFDTEKLFYCSLDSRLLSLLHSNNMIHPMTKVAIRGFHYICSVQMPYVAEKILVHRSEPTHRPIYTQQRSSSLTDIQTLPLQPHTYQGGAQEHRIFIR